MIDVQLSQIAGAIRSVSHGDSSGPMGLEMLAMALAGKGRQDSVASALSEIASAIRELAQAVDNRK